MSLEDELGKHLAAVLAKQFEGQAPSATIPTVNAASTCGADSPAEFAEQEFQQEQGFWIGQVRAEQIQDMRSVRTQREDLAGKVFLLVALWMAGIFLIVMAQGLSPSWHPLASGVMIALITTTTANLIGTLLIVLKFIFHVPGEHD